MAGDLDPAIITALVTETATKADLVWVEVNGQSARALWHVWHDGAATVVTGGREQPDPGFVDGGSVRLILRSKDKATRVLTINAVVERIDPTSERWDEVAKALHPQRLNATDGEEQPRRWSQESDVWRLRPVGEPVETPGDMSDESQRAVPRPTDATTDDWQPFHAGKATHRRR